ncbi:MAG: ABC transporter ATP-binding protein [Desulfobacula sp. GWF2_41_7]|nr:MAG: ABC transporter ATP-binding protein [Desulfobacula sp. GWF2_41_7]
MNQKHPPSLIEIQAVSKTFQTHAGSFSGLKEITLVIHKGEFVAVTGKSGSGKSTLLNMITAIDYPSEGKVLVNSINAHALSESRQARWRGCTIGIVFQFFQLIPNLTVMENLLLPMDFINVIPKGERKKRAGLLLEQVDIFRHKDKLPSALSGGQQQRAAIARALANAPPLVVADEPTGNLDSETAKGIHELFYHLVLNGKTVVVVTHEDTREYKYDRVLVMKDGKMEQGRPI